MTNWINGGKTCRRHFPVNLYLSKKVLTLTSWADLEFLDTRVGILILPLVTVVLAFAINIFSINNLAMTVIDSSKIKLMTSLVSVFPVSWTIEQSETSTIEALRPKLCPNNGPSSSVCFPHLLCARQRWQLLFLDQYQLFFSSVSLKMISPLSRNPFPTLLIIVGFSSFTFNQIFPGRLSWPHLLKCFFSV